MLDTYPQWILALIFVGFGIFCGIIIGIMSAINILLGNKKIIRIIVDILNCLATTSLYLIIINLLNYGEHRLYLVLTFGIGIFIERKTLGKLFAKLYHKLYNLIVTKLEVLSKSKFGTILKR